MSGEVSASRYGAAAGHGDSGGDAGGSFSYCALTALWREGGCGDAGGGCHHIGELTDDAINRFLRNGVAGFVVRGNKKDPAHQCRVLVKNILNTGSRNYLRRRMMSASPPRPRRAAEEGSGTVVTSSTTLEYENPPSPLPEPTAGPVCRIPKNKN